jgi:protein O-mannosyl-transferase
MNASRKPIWLALLLAAGTAILYWPVIGHQFIGYDDNQYLVQNWHIQSGLTGRAIAWAFQSGYASNWHPLTWISHMLDWQFYGANPMGHHLTNLILHALNSALLFVWLFQMTRARWRSAFVAALFAWHPLHVESVAWAAERKDVLCALFWILTLMAYTRYVREKSSAAKKVGTEPEIVGEPASATKFHPLPGSEGGHKGTSVRSQPSETTFYYGLSLFLFALALMSKPMAVTLPFVLLLVDFWPLERFPIFSTNSSLASDDATRKRNLKALILEKIPFFGLAMVASIITFKVQQAGGAVNSLRSASFVLRFENAFLAYLRYLGKTVWPTKLAVLYPLSSHLPILAVVGAVVLFLLICAAAFWSAKRAPYVLSGWFWFAGTLVPVIGIVQVGAQSMADRYTYIPSIGLFIVLAWGAVDLFSKLPQARNVLAAAAVVVLAASCVVTRDQLAYWQNGEILFRHTIAVTDHNYLAYSWLSTCLEEEGRMDEAMQCATKSVELQPNFPEGHYNLGSLLLDTGKTDEAIQQFETALKQYPGFADAENNLGKAFETEGKLDDAAAHLAAAHSDSPKDPDILNNLGSVLLEQSKLPEAAVCFSEALKIMPDHADAHGNLGVILMRTGHPEEGTLEFAEKVRLKPKDPGARLNYGLALLDQNHPAEAATQFNEALRLQPDSALGHYRLSLALAKQGNSQEAITQCREALRLQPDFPDAHDALEQWTHRTN